MFYVRFVFTSNCLQEGSCLSYLCCLCEYSCVQHALTTWLKLRMVYKRHELLFFHGPFFIASSVFSNVYLKVLILFDTFSLCFFDFSVEIWYCADSVVLLFFSLLRFLTIKMVSSRKNLIWLIWFNCNFHLISSSINLSTKHIKIPHNTKYHIHKWWYCLIQDAKVASSYPTHGEVYSMQHYVTPVGGFFIVFVGGFFLEGRVTHFNKLVHNGK